MYYEWRPYVTVAARQARARREMARLRKEGVDVQPVVIQGRLIARSFWGKAWCEHLESFGDFANRLPRGQRYARNGSVCHLAISAGRIEAYVAGSELYQVEVEIDTLPAKRWQAIKSRCSGQLGSLIELLQGKLSDGVLSVVTDRKKGLFPLRKEISYWCDCPDSAAMCKHIAAVFYGTGARLDSQPELLFLLRGVDQNELVASEAAAAAIVTGSGRRSRRKLDSSALTSVFGIEVEAGAPQPEPKKKTVKKGKAKAVKAKAVKAKVVKVKPSEAPIETALRLARRAKGFFTLRELAEARGSSAIGPFARTVKKGIKDGLLEAAQSKDGEDCYIVKQALRPKPKKKKKKAPRVKKAASRQQVLQAADMLEELARSLRSGSRSRAGQGEGPGS